MLFLLLITLEPLHGPFVTAEEACGAALKSPSEGSAFCRRQGLWQVALRDGDGWYVGPLPVQDGVAPVAIEGVPGRYHVRFAQHAFHRGVDVDGEWLWPCVGHACTNQAIPVEIHDRDGGAEIAGNVVISGGAQPRLDVIFWKLRILGDTPRAAEWRGLVENLRGEHSLSLP